MSPDDYHISFKNLPGQNYEIEGNSSFEKTNSYQDTTISFNADYLNDTPLPLEEGPLSVSIDISDYEIDLSSGKEVSFDKDFIPYSNVDKEVDSMVSEVKNAEKINAGEKEKAASVMGNDNHEKIGNEKSKKELVNDADKGNDPEKEEAKKSEVHIDKNIDTDKLNKMFNNFLNMSSPKGGGGSGLGFNKGPKINFNEDNITNKTISSKSKDALEKNMQEFSEQVKSISDLSNKIIKDPSSLSGLSEKVSKQLNNLSESSKEIESVFRALKHNDVNISKVMKSFDSKVVKSFNESIGKAQSVFNNSKLDFEKISNVNVEPIKENIDKMKESIGSITKSLSKAIGIGR